MSEKTDVLFESIEIISSGKIITGGRGKESGGTPHVDGRKSVSRVTKKCPWNFSVFGQTPFGLRARAVVDKSHTGRRCKPVNPRRRASDAYQTGFECSQHLRAIRWNLSGYIAVYIYIYISHLLSRRPPAADAAAAAVRTGLCSSLVFQHVFFSLSIRLSARVLSDFIAAFHRPRQDYAKAVYMYIYLRLHTRL